MIVRALAAAFAVSLALTACSGKQTPQEEGTKTMTDTEYTDAMAKEHATDSPDPSGAVAAAENGSMTTAAQMTPFGTVEGGEVQGYLAAPDEPGTYPAVIMIHEWWGLNDNIKTMADKLASHGYRVLAVDLYAGTVATTPDEAKAAMSAVDEAKAKQTLRAAHQFLVDGGATSIGVVGWCFGGGWALETGVMLGEEVDAVVMYYGRPKTTVEEVKPLDAPLLGVFGADDQGIPVDQVRKFETALGEAGEEATIEIYEGAGHAFANPSGDNYVESAANDAWKKTLAFFEKHLRG